MNKPETDNSSTPPRVENGKGSDAAACSALSLEIKVKAAVAMIPSPDIDDAIAWTVEYLRQLELRKYPMIEVRDDKARLKCRCGEVSTGWTTVKCCNICGNPHADEELSWSFSLLPNDQREGLATEADLSDQNDQ